MVWVAKWCGPIRRGLNVWWWNVGLLLCADSVPLYKSLVHHLLWMKAQDAAVFHPVKLKEKRGLLSEKPRYTLSTKSSHRASRHTGQIIRGERKGRLPGTSTNPSIWKTNKCHKSILRPYWGESHFATDAEQCGGKLSARRWQHSQPNVYCVLSEIFPVSPRRSTFLEATEIKSQRRGCSCHFLLLFTYKLMQPHVYFQEDGGTRVLPASSSFSQNSPSQRSSTALSPLFVKNRDYEGTACGILLHRIVSRQKHACSSLTINYPLSAE